MTQDRQEWVWRGIRLVTPGSWEMLRFSRRADQGLCAFADRYGFRLELSWRKVPGPPDYERMMNDYAAKLADTGMREPRRLVRDGWPGIAGEQDGVFTTRFGRFLEGCGYLVELVFLWPDGFEEKTERDILKSVRAEAPAGGMLRWRAFGMEIVVPRAATPQACNVAPGRAELVFGGPGRRERWTFSRVGMVDTWLGRPLEEWFQQHPPEGLRWRRTRRREAAGHGIHAGYATRPLLGVPGTTGQWAEVESWRCPADGRVYTVTHTDSRRRTRPAHPRGHDVFLRCPDTMRRVP
jgi:hypothetical protein